MLFKVIQWVNAFLFNWLNKKTTTTPSPSQNNKNGGGSNSNAGSGSISTTSSTRRPQFSNNDAYKSVPIVPGQSFHK